MSYQDIYSTKDTHLNSQNPNTNYGTDQYFVVGRGTYYHSGLLYFDLSSVVGANLSKVELYLYQWASGDAGELSFSVNCIDQKWSESTATWNNQPTYTETSAATFTQSGTVEGWKSYDVTTLVTDILDNSRTYHGLILRQIGTTSNVQKVFGTREWFSTIVILRCTFVPLQVWSGAEWKDSTKVQVYDGATWQEATGIQVYDGATWKTAY